MKDHIETIYIVGLGALGSMYAAKFYDVNPALVKIIADKKRVGAYKKSGVAVNGKSYNFDFLEPGVRLQPPADLLIIAVKYGQLQQAIKDANLFVGPDTIVISLLNGISSEEDIGVKIGIDHLLYAYAVGMDAVREGNDIRYNTPGKIVFGEKHNEMLSTRVVAVKQLFDRAGIIHQIPLDMERALWAKFMMNVGVNQVSAVLRCAYGLLQRNKDARGLILMAAKEVMELSKRAGINLDQSNIDEFVGILDGLNPSGKTSMLQDIEAGRKSEADLFAGTVIKLGKQYNMPTPVNETLYRIILAMEG